MEDDDKKLTVRLPRDAWSKACVNARLKGFNSIQEFIRSAIASLNERAEELEKSKALVEADKRG